jgi:hypothetical protein
MLVELLDRPGFKLFDPCPAMNRLLLAVVVLFFQALALVEIGFEIPISSVTVADVRSQQTRSHHEAFHAYHINPDLSRPVIYRFSRTQQSVQRSTDRYQ